VVRGKRGWVMTWHDGLIRRGCSLDFVIANWIVESGLPSVVQVGDE
jgi:hypothetical protein